MNRRDFLKLSATGGMAATLAGCTDDPLEKLIPILNPPPHFVPGRSYHYATMCRECTAACGLFVKTREGRAIKVEGNPLHPFNKGKVCPKGQAALQGLYNPARIKGPARKTGDVTETIDWKTGIDLLVTAIKEHRVQTRKKILMIGQPETGSREKLLRNCLTDWGGGDYIALDLMPLHSMKLANDLVFGEPVVPFFDLSQASTLINFGSDFLESWLQPMLMSAGYTEFHAYQQGSKGRFIQIAPCLTLTGANADRWIACKPGSEHVIAFALVRRMLSKSNVPTTTELARLKALIPDYERLFADTYGADAGLILDELEAVLLSGNCICMAGGNITAGDSAVLLQMAVNLLNYLTGAINNTISFGADYRLGGDSLQKVKQALKGLAEGAYQLVIIINANPVYALPQLKFLESAIRQVPMVVSFSTELDETSRLANLYLPTHHYLESWGDGHPAEGVHVLQQPVMQTVPGYDTRDLGDLLLQVSYLANPAGFRYKDYRSYLQATWKQIHQSVDPQLPFMEFWRSSLRQGGSFQTAAQRKVSLNASLFDFDFPEKAPIRAGLTLLAVNSNLQDSNGHSGNKYWLLETPHPLWQTAWDNCVAIHPDTAARMGIRDRSPVELTTRYGSLQTTAMYFYGVDPNTLILATGWGRSVLFPNYKSAGGTNPFFPILESRKESGLIERRFGTNPLLLFSDQHEVLSGDYLFVQPDVTIKQMAGRAHTVFVDGQSKAGAAERDDQWWTEKNQKGRGLVRTLTDPLSVDSITNNSDQQDQKKGSIKENGDLYSPIPDTVAYHRDAAKNPPPPYFESYKWEMVVDLDRCTGCSACVVACYAENNIAIVGKERMLQGREMSWIRIERFFEINERTGRTETYFSPQMCAQCDNAGCEPVCPVAATYKTADGLNAMIYNRCIGSRYCANNCIFMQRRFNWRNYYFPSPLQYQLNPDVTVRSKGVMEKCTFCHQRIREALLFAKAEGRTLKGDEIQTACQQTCPTNAITFGNAALKTGDVSRLKSQQARRYTQFEELNYQPAVTYLKKVLHDQQKA